MLAGVILAAHLEKASRVVVWKGKKIHKFNPEPAVYIAHLYSLHIGPH